MGLLRFLLAAAVVLAHSHSDEIASIPFLNAGVAVCAFFIISGFYMAMVLDQKYRDKIKLFYLNRFIRVSLPYYFVLLAALFIYFGASWYKGHWIDRLQYWSQLMAQSDYATALLLSLPQLTLIGIDFVCLLTLDFSQGLQWILPAPHGGIVPAGSILAERMLFVPQAWSISFELVFYLLAPWLNRRSTRFLVSLTLCSLALKILFRIYLGGGVGTKWDQQFLPPQFGFFTLGMLAFRLKGFLVPRVQAALKSYFLLFFGLLFVYKTLPPLVAEPLFLLLTFIGLPALFAQTQASKIDGWIGDLSYPMYLTHIMVRWLMLGTSAQAFSSVAPGKLLVATILFSILFVFCLEKPLDRWRHSLQ
jgi:peptidoglycan/LPS O-acetylase OafA/YrhL